MDILSQKTLDVINNVLEVGKLFNIGVFIIDDFGIRAKAEESYIFLTQKVDFDFLEFDSLCISRVSELNTRLNFMENTSGKGGFNIYAAETKTLDSGDNIVLKLRMVSDTTSVEITADNGAKHDIPKTINEPELVSFTIDANSIEVLSGIQRAVQSKNKAINIEMVNGVIVTSSRDVHRDYMNHILSKTPVFVNDPAPFSFMYNLTNFVPMMRGRMKMDITLTERGLMLTELNGIKVIIFPEKIAD